VYSKWDNWNLDDIAYNAPKITVTDPQNAVKELALVFYWYKDLQIKSKTLNTLTKHNKMLEIINR